MKRLHASVIARYRAGMSQPDPSLDFLTPQCSTKLSRRSQTLTRLDQTRPPKWREETKLANRTVAYLWPWTRKAYPGLRKGLMTDLGRELDWSSVRHWFAGRVNFPIWAVEALLPHIRGRVSAGIALIEELERYAAIRTGEIRHLSPGLHNRRTDD